jgi:hypothetical protein
VILSGLFIYLALLIRSLEDPYRYPTIESSTPVSDTGHRDGYCEGLYRLVQLTIAPKLTSRETSDESRPSFGLFAAYECGSPIDLTVLAHGFGYQICQKFRTSFVTKIYHGHKSTLLLETVTSQNFESTIVWCTSVPQGERGQKVHEGLGGYSLSSITFPMPVPEIVQTASLQQSEHVKSPISRIEAKDVQHGNVSTFDNIAVENENQIMLSGRA